MSPTKIAWATETWNPVTGCSKVSPGCAYCYAERLSTRFGRTTKPWTPENAAENVVLHPERLDIPLHWQKPRRIFVCSTSDLFHPSVEDEYIDRVFAVMAASPQHTFLVLTKRSERMYHYLTSGFLHDRRSDLVWAAMSRQLGTNVPRTNERWPGWPLPNVWVGVSIENAARPILERADALRTSPAAVRFISAEPLLGPLVLKCSNCGGVGHRSTPYGFTLQVRQDCLVCRGAGLEGLDLPGIDWLIIGGESGPHARPMNPQWALDLIEAARAAGTKVFVKQASGLRPGTQGDLPDWAFALREYPR